MAAMDIHEGSRKVLQAAVGILCKEQGFDGATTTALETLTEIIQSYLTEVAVCAQEYSQLCQRTTPDLSDVRMALIDLGADIDNLHTYGLRPNQEKISDLPCAKVPCMPKPLPSALKKQQRPSYVPDHLPAFPDVYTYIKTPTIRHPPNEYQMARERYASQKAEMELSLTRFVSRMRPAQLPIFENMNREKYPLVDHTPSFTPYLKALLPSSEETISASLAGPNKMDDDTMDSQSQDSQDLSIESLDNPYLRSPRKVKVK